MSVGLFVPGWGAPAQLYEPALPHGWTALEAPAFATAAGSLEHYRRWLLDEVCRLDRPVVLAGHSMGGALALCTAATIPELVERLVLVGPAGLPLLKPMKRSIGDFATQLARRRYPLSLAGRGITGFVQAPRSALAVARAVRALDLSIDMAGVRAAGIPATVVGCSTDTLVTLEHCRRIARSLGARYRELQLQGGHMWMLQAPLTLRGELA